MENKTDGWRLGRREATSAGEVAYEVFGEGPPVVLVHGTPTRSYLWRNVTPSLTERNSLYVYDLLGFGESERKEGQDLSIAAQSRLLNELVDAWGLDKPAVVGHDIGGGIVLRSHLIEGMDCARIALVDAVVVTPWMPEANEHFKAHMDAYRTMPPHLFEAIVAAHFREATSPKMDGGAWEAYMDQWRGEEGKLAFLRKEVGLRERDTAELESRLGEVNVPVLVVWGGEDAWLDPSQADRLGEAIPNSRVKKMPGVGHFVPEDTPKELAWELSAFLAEVEEQTVKPWRLRRRAEVSGGEIAFEVFGEGPPVILIHGTPSRSYLWRGVAPALAEQFSVYAFDLLGYGDSRPSGEDVSIAAQARALAELLKRWDLDGPSVAGHDIGGAIALRAHLLEGVRFDRMALLDVVVLRPWITEASRHVQAHMDAYRTMPTHIFEQVVAAHLCTAVYRPMDGDAFEAYMDQWRGESGREAYLQKVAQFDERLTAEFESLLGSVQMPVGILWGEQDAWLSPAFARRLHELLPTSAEPALIPEAGHFVMEDAPKEVARELLGFFSAGERCPQQAKEDRSC